MNIGESLLKLCMDSGIYALLSDPKPLIMIAIACVLLYLAIVKKYEPLLLMPIAFGMLLTNLPIAGMYHEELFAGGHANWSLFGGGILFNSSALVNAAQYSITAEGAILDAAGNMLGHIVDTLSGTAFAFNASGAVMADGAVFADSVQVIMNSAGAYISGGQVYSVAGTLLATAGQTITPGLLDYLYLGVKLGIYPCLIFLGVGCMTDFGPLIANPKSLLLGAAAQLGIFITFIVCYTVMGFTPQEAASTGIIGGADGPTAIYLTGKLAPHLLGPIAVTIIVSLLLPSAAPLVGCLMLGNLFRESGVVDRLNKTAQNELMNIVTIFLGTTVGATATAQTFLQPKTLGIIVVGVVAFGCGTAGGLLLAKLMNKLTGGKINPLIGSAGVSAVPMAARVSQVEGQKANPSNFLLMHAMGPNVAGVIGSAIAAGILLSMFG